MRSGSSRRGFTLVEAVASVALLGVGVAAVMGALGAMTANSTRVRETEFMQRLAYDKYRELVATGQTDSAQISGDFSDREDSLHQWEAETGPSGIDNVETLRVTVQRNDRREVEPVEIDGLIFRPPQTTDTGAQP